VSAIPDNGPLFIEREGAYWAAKVLARLDDGRVVVRYDGQGSERDEVVPAGRVWLEAPPLERYRRGDSLFVDWHGAYWRAHVLSIKKASRVSIRYDGYGPEWNEVVGPDRIKHLQQLEE
jgi:hypothetical protein